MRPPQHLIESLWFQFSSLEEFVLALKGQVDETELGEIGSLSARGFPPVTSIEAVSALIGVNTGIVWSFILRPDRYYRTFTLTSGTKQRTITAPRVGLKLIQTWMAYHLSRTLPVLPHVFGFVPKRSHIDAAFVHREAEWAFSVDIKDFFQTTPKEQVVEGLKAVGYGSEAAELVAKLSCWRGHLAQGAPSSPALSNLAFYLKDEGLVRVAEKHGVKLTRFADDIVFSGQGEFPSELRDEVHSLFRWGPWKLAAEKERLEPIKGRIKVHGLIVNGERVRLTKGYRNKLRAYRHIMATRVAPEDAPRLQGHLEYERHVNWRLSTLYDGQLTLPAMPSNPPEFEVPISHRIESAGQSTLVGLRAFLKRLGQRLQIPK